MHKHHHCCKCPECYEVTRMAALRRMDAPSYGGDWQAEPYGYPPGYGGGQTLPPPASGGGGSMAGGGGGGVEEEGEVEEEEEEEEEGALWGEVRARLWLVGALEAPTQRANPNVAPK
ncbi:hypothetical protein VZT92_023545 [Zoarces viviparus]|uniref:Uncharacterized protein n=1 Tax=Zoarces viviparus TaxID=48416 RepID=A0AAW1E6U1_ZOAVI